MHPRNPWGNDILGTTPRSPEPIPPKEKAASPARTGSNVRNIRNRAGQAAQSAIVAAKAAAPRHVPVTFFAFPSRGYWRVASGRGIDDRAFPPGEGPRPA